MVNEKPKYGMHVYVDRKMYKGLGKIIKVHEEAKSCVVLNENGTICNMSFEEALQNVVIVQEEEYK